MRDNSECCPEIVDAYEREGLFFAVIRVTLPIESAAFEFGVEQKGYASLRRILQYRPFDNAPGLRYRYFFTGTYGRKVAGAEPVTISVRVEYGTKGKNFDFDCPTSLASNLRWFISLTDLAAASGLKRVL